MESAICEYSPTAIFVEASPSPHGVGHILSAAAWVEVVGTADSASTALDLVREKHPALVILVVGRDASIPMDVCREINAEQLDTRVLVVAFREDDTTLATFVRLGVSGYIPGSASSAEFSRAVCDVSEGRFVFPPTIATKVRALMMGSHEPDQAAGSRDLTFRELEVLRCMSRGLRNQAIADALSISEKTVQTHVRHVLLKLGVRSRTQAAVQAVRNGWC